MALDKKSPPADFRPDEKLAANIRSRLSEDGRLPCAEAFAAAQAMNLPPGLVGRTADALGIRLSRCQLGLFGYPGKAKGWMSSPAEVTAPPGFADALSGLSASPTCPALWRLADAFGVSRLQAGQLADELGLKVVGCPLGAF